MGADEDEKPRTLAENAPASGVEVHDGRDGESEREKNVAQKERQDTAATEKGAQVAEHRGDDKADGLELDDVSEPDSPADAAHADQQPPLRPQQSRVSSTFSRTAAIVPWAERRGLLAHLAIIPELERPYEYKNKTKWIITATVAICAIAAPIGSAIFYPALNQISAEFGASPTVTNLSIAFYMLSMSIFPLWWSSFSETLGRRTVYLISFSLFLVFSILSAVSKNIGMLIAMRILSGGASASVQAVGAGTIADVWEPRERGRAMGFFYLGPLTGPLFAPIIGGALTQRWGWRSTMWFLAIFGGIILPLILLALPETLPRRNNSVAAEPAQPTTTDGQLTRMSTRQSVQQHTKRAGLVVKRLIIDPLQVLLFLRFPPVLVTVYFAAITFGSLFVMNISVQSTFSRPPYNFSELVVGLLYLPPSLGYVLASLLGGRWIDRIMAREAQKAGRYDAHGKLVYLPEDRLRENAWLAATVYPAALIWYGWTAQRGVYWLVPSVANFFFGCGSMLVFGAVTTMLTEFMPRRSSTGVALNNFVRNIFSCVGAIVSQPLIDAMGNGWLFTMVGLLACTTGCLCIWSLKRYGPQWRKLMDEKLNPPTTR